MKNNITRLEERSTKQIFYANETDFFTVQFNDESTSTNTSSYNENSECIMNFIIDFNSFHKYSQIKSIILKVKFETSAASVKLNNEGSLTSNCESSSIEFNSDNNGFINIDLLNYCNLAQLNSNCFSLVFNDTYNIYKDTTSINDYKPQLIVEYIDDCESIINQKTIEGSAGRALNYSVNVRSGRPTFVKPLLSINTTVMPINLGLYFNPLEATLVSHYMPKGWRFNYNQTLIPNDEGYEYTDGVGNIHQFVKSNDSSVYYDISGSGLILIKISSSKQVIDDGYNRQLTFNGYKLVSIIDKLNNNEYGLKFDYLPMTNCISSIKEYIKLSTDSQATLTEKVAITYDEGVVGFTITSTGFPTITTTGDSNNNLVSIKEEDDRVSTYTYDSNNMLETAYTDNGEKVVFTYDSRYRIKTITDCVTSESNTLSKLTFDYECLATSITNNYCVKMVYQFNGEGELIAQYEEDNGEILNAQYIKLTDNLKELTSLSNEAYLGFSDISLYSNSSSIQTHNTNLSKGDVDITTDNYYVLMFTYNLIDKTNSNYTSYITVMQDNDDILIYELSNGYYGKRIQGIPFKVKSESPLSVKVYHRDCAAQLIVENIKISQTNLVKVESVTNWTMGEITHEYSMVDMIVRPILAKGYINEDISTTCRLTLEDIVETQKNAALTPDSYNAWYNNKRGLLANVNNLKIWGETGASYDLLSKCYGVLNKTNEVINFEYTDYETDIDLEDYICTVYNKSSIYGYEKKLKETHIKKNLQPIMTFDYSNGNNIVVTEYEFDDYGNLILEKFENRTNGLYTQKEYQYNKKILTKEIVKEAGNTLTTLYQINQYTGNVEKVTLPNGCVIDYSYVANTDGKLSEISSTVNGVKNTNVFSYKKDKIGGYNTNRYGYYIEYDKYNMPRRLNCASCLIWTTSKTFNTDTIVETTYLDNGYHYIENTYDKYGNLVISKEGSSNNNLEVVSEVYYSDIIVDEISTTDPLSNTLKKNSYSKLRKKVDNILNNTTEYRYNADGNIKSIKNSAEDYKPSVTSYTFDQNNKLTNKISKLENGTTFVEVDNFVFEDNTYKDKLTSIIMYYNNPGKKELVCSLIEDKDTLGRIGTQTFKINDSIDILRRFTYKDVDDNVSGLIERLDLEIDSTINEQLYYEYDNMGRITKVYNTSNSINNTYTYDILGRLIRENNKALNKTTVYSYDLGGNILSKKVSSYTLGTLPTTATIYNYEYDQYHADYLTKYNRQTVSFTNNGNITKIGSISYSWDRYRFLSQVKKSSNDYVNMSYDVDGIRYKKTHYNNGTTIVHNYVCEGTKILSEKIIGGSNEGELNYLYIGKEIIGFTYKNNQYFFQKNLQGDIIRLYDTSNNLVAYYEYDAWGNHRVYSPTGTINTSDTFIGNINPFRYRGYYYDRESNLYYCNTRYYNPELLRWMSLDSIDYAEPNRLNGCNLYAYCGNDPVNYFDGFGHMPVPIDITSNLIGWTTQFLEYIEKLSFNKMSIIDMNMAKKIARKAGHIDSARDVMKANNAMYKSTQNSVNKLHKFNKYFGLAMYGLDIGWIIVENVVTKNPNGVTDSIVDIGISSAIYALSFVPYAGWALAIVATIFTEVYDDEIEVFKDSFADGWNNFWNFS